MHLNENLTRGILVDEVDNYLLKRHLFNTAIAGYATTEISGKTVRLHRMILITGEFIDHRNMNKLDNRRENLRVASRAQNGFNSLKLANNTSGYKGVTKSGTNWRVQIKINGKPTALGTFLTKEEAARVYDNAAKKYHGEFANLNFKLGGLIEENNQQPKPVSLN